MTRKKEPKAHKQARELFYEAVFPTSYLYESGCWFSHVVSHKCDGPIDPCHVIDKQGLWAVAKGKLSKPEGMAYDPRNAVPGCRAIHNRFDNRMVRVYQDDLPDSVFMFITDWEDALERPGVLQEKLDGKCPKGTRP